jgi:hypothetical protein
MGKLIDLGRIPRPEADRIMERVVDLDARVFRYRSPEDQQRYAEGMRDLSRGEKFVILYEKGSELIGYNLISIHPVEIGARRVWVVGSTAGLLPGHTGQNRTMPDAIRAMVLHKLRHPERSYYFVCFMGGPGSYDLLADLCPATYPSIHTPLSDGFERALIAHTARHDGVEVIADEPERFIATVGCVAKQVIPPRRSSEHVRFYERLNPGHADGDLLGICAPLDWPSLLAGGYRSLRRTLRKRVRRQPASSATSSSG